jgi:hypothetical protein
MSTYNQPLQCLAGGYCKGDKPSLCTTKGCQMAKAKRKKAKKRRVTVKGA